ncbi:MAG: metallo-mystery pair system four-Cys motif protein [Alphaproteobacteria bacterium]|nr:metallo-mystery pair system four-Cys motif protein [Alphaproteobacteria bacterium]
MTAFLMLVACANAEVTLNFEAVVEDSPFVCGGPVTLTDGATVEITDFRLFLHDLALLDDEGKREPLRIDDDGAWAKDGTVLLDFEDGCLNGTPSTNTTVTGRTREGDYTGLAFTVGVPFEQNHDNPAAAEAPLSTTSMHWTWQAGYKFIRLDYERDGQGGQVHLGSAGCQGTVGDITGCDRPNRASAEVALGDTVVVDLGPLVRAPTCMGTDDASCAAVYDALGMDLSTGEPVTTASLFSAR